VISLSFARSTVVYTTAASSLLTCLFFVARGAHLFILVLLLFVQDIDRFVLSAVEGEVVGVYFSMTHLFVLNYHKPLAFLVALHEVIDLAGCTSYA
jgi:hypothetical protein